MQRDLTCFSIQRTLRFQALAHRTRSCGPSSDGLEQLNFRISTTLTDTVFILVSTHDIHYNRPLWPINVTFKAAAADRSTTATVIEVKDLGNS